MFPEMFGYENTLFGPKGKAHKVFGKRKNKFCGVQGPGSLASGSKRWEPWRLAQESEKDSCLSGETDFVQAFTPSFDPKAQHINRGVGLAPKTYQETPSRVPATPSPLVYPPSSSCSAWRSPAEIFLHHQPSLHHRAAGTHLLLRPSCWIEKAKTPSS